MSCGAVRMTRHYTRHAEGSVLVEFGDTRVICTASVERRVPRFLLGRGSGWVTAEYGMLPRATSERTAREAATGAPGGADPRDPAAHRPEPPGRRRSGGPSANAPSTSTATSSRRTGGTRTAAISGGYVALADAVATLRKPARREALHGQVAAVSVGIWNGRPVLDLDYAEDRDAETDMNVVMNDNDGFVEIQGTAEGHAFRSEELDAMLSLARAGIGRIIEVQRQVLGE